GAGEDLRAEDAQAGGAKGAGHVAEQAGAVPGANLGDGVAAVGFVVPVDDGFEGVAFLGDLQMEEAVGQDEIALDFRRGMDLEITSWQRAEMGMQLLLADASRQGAMDFLRKQFALLRIGEQEL